MEKEFENEQEQEQEQAASIDEAQKDICDRYDVYQQLKADLENQKAKLQSAVDASMDPDEYQKAREKIVDMDDKVIAAKESYTACLLKSLENYLKFIIAQNSWTLGGEYEDLMQSGREAILTQVDRYNPHMSKPSSFLTPYIKAFMKSNIKRDGVGTYYLAKERILDRYAKESGKTGLTDPTLNVADLSVMSNIPVITIMETIKAVNFQKVSLTEVNENFNLPNRYKTPEGSLLEKEQSEFLSDLFKQLTPLEQFLIQQNRLADNPTSLRGLLTYLKTDEALNDFPELKEIKPKLTQIMLQRMINAALQKLRKNPKTKEYFNKEEEEPIEMVVQATEEDIANALRGNYLDL